MMTTMTRSVAEVLECSESTQRGGPTRSTQESVASFVPHHPVHRTPATAGYSAPEAPEPPGGSGSRSKASPRRARPPPPPFFFNPRAAPRSGDCRQAAGTHQQQRPHERHRVHVSGVGWGWTTDGAERRERAHTPVGDEHADKNKHTQGGGEGRKKGRVACSAAPQQARGAAATSAEIHTPARKTCRGAGVGRRRWGGGGKGGGESSLKLGHRKAHGEGRQQDGAGRRDGDGRRRALPRAGVHVRPHAARGGREPRGQLNGVGRGLLVHQQQLLHARGALVGCTGCGGGAWRDTGRKRAQPCRAGAGGHTTGLHAITPPPLSPFPLEKRRVGHMQARTPPCARPATGRTTSCARHARKPARGGGSHTW
jgi:hypothetical protein